MTLRSYQPVWSETVVFWGAGATNNLNMLTTSQLGTIIFYLTQTKKTVIERVSQAFESRYFRKEIYVELADFIECMEATEPPWPILNKYFSDNTHGRKYYDNLQKQYDWEALRHLVMICPGHNASLKLNDLYNLIDMHLFNQQGISTRIEGKPQYMRLERVIKARVTLNMLIVTLQAYQYRLGLHSENYRDMMDQYQNFADELAFLMREEGLALYRQGIELHERRFYLFSYTLISMNWDSFLLWFIFIAHRRLNKHPPYIGEQAMPLKLFNDMGHFMGVRRIDSVKPELWYPLNETVAQRLNDKEHLSRRVRVGKYYFPHGSLNWRECPWCGKVVMHLGDKWENKSDSLFPSTMLPGTRKDEAFCRSKEEQEAIQEGRLDAMQCPYCGGMTDCSNVPMIMQSSFKGNHPPFVEEIQRDMRISLEHAKHFVFLGYRMPEDDFIYRSLMAARRYSPEGKDNPYFSVVGYDQRSPAGWIDVHTAEYKEYARNNSDADIVNTVKQLQDIFDDPGIRIFGQGIPAVFQDSGSRKVSRESVRDLLYPLAVFPQGRVER